MSQCGSEFITMNIAVTNCTRAVLFELILGDTSNPVYEQFYMVMFISN